MLQTKKMTSKVMQFALKHLLYYLASILHSPNLLDNLDG